MLGKIEDRRRSGQQRMRWLGGFTDSMDMNLGKLWEMVRDKEAWIQLFNNASLPSEQRHISLTRIRRVLSILVQSVYTQIWKKETWKCSVSLV